MEVLLSISEEGVLEHVAFDDTAGLDVDSDFEEIVDFIHRTTVDIPDNVTRIGERAFYDKRWLLGVMIPDSVLSIGDEAFSDCYYMDRITIPKSVTNIGSKAFVYCEGLMEITILNDMAVIAPDAFFGCSEGLKILAKAGSSAEAFAAAHSIVFESLR